MFHLHATNLSRVVLGVRGIAGGIAYLVLSIVFGISLIITLLLSVATCIAIITLRLWSYDRYKRSLMKRQLQVGLIAGLFATAGYDISRAIVTYVVPSQGRLSHKIKERIEKDILDLRSENQ